jgi:hypothetical protein
MKLRQIRSFLSIAETLHFGRAAEMIHLNQPALSLQIRALEDEIGVRLFERNRRKTALTAAGVAFREDVTAATPPPKWPPPPPRANDLSGAIASRPVNRRPASKLVANLIQFILPKNMTAAGAVLFRSASCEGRIPPSCGRVRLRLTQSFQWSKVESELTH